MRILLVDDHAVFREGFTYVLARLGPDIEIIEAGDIPGALAYTATHQVDLVILDLYLPGYRGLDALHAFRQQFPELRIVLLSGIDDATLVREGLKAGALGFIHKSACGEEVIAAVNSVLTGGSCLVEAALTDGDIGAAPVEQLTQRQREILAHIGNAMSYKQIARCLGISDTTVRNHVMQIFERLGVHSRTEAALLAHRYGLVTSNTNKP